MGKINGIKDILHILKINKKTLSEKYGVTDIAVFGSYARNEQEGKSDIDIFVELKPRFRTFDNFMDLKTRNRSKEDLKSDKEEVILLKYQYSFCNSSSDVKN